MVLDEREASSLAWRRPVSRRPSSAPTPVNGRGGAESPERAVFGGFAGVALMIAIVGMAGVLAFSVSARTREFGVRLAIVRATC